MNEINILIVLLLLLLKCIDGSNSLLQLRGGLVPQASEPGAEYYEKFTLDYGGVDNKRIAGAMRGFIKSDVLPNLPENDPFMKWLNNHLDKGMESVSGRIKPFYAADFGSKSDLNKGENPKIIIVQRKLKGDKDIITKLNLLYNPKAYVFEESKSNYFDIKAKDEVINSLAYSRTNGYKEVFRISNTLSHLYSRQQVRNLLYNIIQTEKIEYDL